MESGIDPDDPDTREERFQFSLDCVLDGIAARLAPVQRWPAAPSGARRQAPRGATERCRDSRDERDGPASPAA